MSNIRNKEISQHEGVPYECYWFECGKDVNVKYLYTSDRENITLKINNDGVLENYTFYSTYITRGEIEPGSKGNDCELEVTVAMDNPVANIYKGMPPETECIFYLGRGHHPDYEHFDITYTGEVKKVSFENTICKITIALEQWLNKEVPKGKYQYTCNNIHYDHNCKLNISDYKKTFFLDKVDENIIYCKGFAMYPDGYFTNGKMWFDGQVRLIEYHRGDTVKLVYPFSHNPRNNVEVAPGCDKLFSTCVNRYGNELNYSGFPYVPPTDTEKNPYGVGSYWINSTFIHRDSNGWIGHSS